MKNKTILKVGVGISSDALKLFKDYQIEVYGILELPAILTRSSLVWSNMSSLKNICSDILNIKLDKNTKIRCSNWESTNLSLYQILYAASDSYYSREIFVASFLSRINPKEDLLPNICFKHLNIFEISKNKLIEKKYLDEKEEKITQKYLKWEDITGWITGLMDIDYIKIQRKWKNKEKMYKDSSLSSSDSKSSIKKLRKTTSSCVWTFTAKKNVNKNKTSL